MRGEFLFAASHPVISAKRSFYSIIPSLEVSWYPMRVGIHISIPILVVFPFSFSFEARAPFLRRVVRRSYEILQLLLCPIQHTHNNNTRTTLQYRKAQTTYKAAHLFIKYCPSCHLASNSAALDTIPGLPES